VTNEKGRLLGFAVMHKTIEGGSQEVNKYSLDWLYVVPTRRREGIAQRLLEQVKGQYKVGEAELN